MDEADFKEILKQVGLEEADLRIKAANEKLREKERECVELAGQLQDKIAQVQQLKQIEDQVRNDRPGKIGLALKENRETWTEGYDSSAKKETIYVDDPIYQQLFIEKELTPILLQPIVQRLAHIKQLSFSHLKFPAATHSRLSHSLGASRNAEHALTRIFEKGVLYTSEGTKEIELSEEEKQKFIRKAKVAGLLHDLGHGPFGHGLDQYVSAMINEPSPDKFFGVDYIQEYLGDVITEDLCGLDMQDVLAILDPAKRTELEGYDVLISNLIDSPLDVDRMDYLVRDAHMTGLSIGAVNIDALIERMMPFEGAITNLEGIDTNQVLLTFDRSAIPYITHVLYARDSMYLNCYEHPGKVLAERMLTKAVEAFSEKNPTVTLQDLLLLTDEELLKTLIRFSNAGDLARHYAVALLTNTPFREVFSIPPRKYAAYLKRKAAREDEGLPSPEEEEVPPKPSELVEAWERFALNLKERNLQTPRNWENKLTEDAALGEDSWKVVVTVPVKMVAPKFDDIKILEETNPGYKYSKLDKLTGYWESVLKHIAIERYSIRVFALSGLPEEKIEGIYESARKLFTLA